MTAAPLWKVLSTPTEFVAELMEIFPRDVAGVVLAYARMPAYETMAITPHRDLGQDSDGYMDVGGLAYLVERSNSNGLFVNCTGCCCPGIPSTKLDVKIIRPPDSDVAILEGNTLRLLPSGRAYDIPSGNTPLSLIGTIYLSHTHDSLFAYNLATQKLVPFITLTGLQGSIKIELPDRVSIIAPKVGPRIFMSWENEAMILEWRDGCVHGYMTRAPPRGRIYPLVDGQLLIGGYRDMCIWDLEAGSGQFCPFEEVYGVMSNGTIIGNRICVVRGEDRAERVSTIPGLMGYNPRHRRLESERARETSLGEVIIYLNDDTRVWNQTDGRSRLQLQERHTKIMTCGEELVCAKKGTYGRRSDRVVIYYRLS